MASSTCFTEETNTKLQLAATYLLSIYFFLSGCFTKSFVYWKMQIGPIPLYVSEITLILSLALLSPKIIRFVRNHNHFFFLCLTAYLIWGGIGTLRGLISLPNLDYDRLKVLKDSAIYFQGIWILVATGLQPMQLKLLFCSALAGAAFAQFLGWIGFILFGTFTSEIATLIGIPVGNEAINTMYVLAFAVMPIGWASAISFFYGKSWLVQFLLYFKRTWVFSILIFSLPALYYASKTNFRRRILALIAITILGASCSYLSIKFVAQRNESVVGRLTKEQAAEKPSFWIKVLSLIFPPLSFEGESTQKTFSKKFFHGEAPKTLVSDSHGLFAFRLHLWKQAWDGFLQKPILGQGFGPRVVQTQVNGEIAFWDGNWFSGPHNSFLSVAFRMGLPGLLLLAFLNLNIFVSAIRKWKNLSEEEILYGAIILNMNSFAFFNVCLENPQSGVWYWFFMGAFLVVAGEAKRILAQP